MPRRNPTGMSKLIVLDEPAREFLASLKSLRKSTGLSLKRLGAKLNIDATSVLAWETGKAYPSLDKLINLAELFNYDISESINYKYFYRTLKYQSLCNAIKHYGFTPTELWDMTGYQRYRIKHSLLMDTEGSVQCLAAILEVLEEERKLVARRRQL